MRLHFRRIATLLALSVATAALACSDATDEPLRASYSLSLHQDSIQEFNVPECIGVADMYCRGWQPNTTVIQASLDGTTAPPTVNQAGEVLAVDSGSFNLDSLAFRLQNTQSPGCVFLTMRIASSGTAVRGTWTEQVDCHGRYATGTVSGSRN